MVQWICELGRVQLNNNSVNEIFVRVGVWRRKLKVGAACSQVVGVCFLRRDEGGKDMAWIA